MGIIVPYSTLIILMKEKKLTKNDLLLKLYLRTPLLPYDMRLFREGNARIRINKMHQS